MTVPTPRDAADLIRTTTDYPPPLRVQEVHRALLDAYAAGEAAAGLRACRRCTAALLTVTAGLWGSLQ